MKTDAVIAARLEVPELDAALERVRAAGCDLDLAARFRAHEERVLFRTGLDRLDASGHDVLARELLDAVLADPGLVPARDGAEREARAAAAAARWLAGRRIPRACCRCSCRSSRC